VEADPLLRRIGRTAVYACALMAALALALSPSHMMSALAVLGGGVLAGTSYVAIESAVTALVERFASSSEPPLRRPALHWTLLKVTGRYALLGFAAYVMIARLRLSPLGLLAGASSVVAAVAVEAVRLLIKKDSTSRT
jgi:hypothetical protein